MPLFLLKHKMITFFIIINIYCNQIELFLTYSHKSFKVKAVLWILYIHYDYLNTCSVILCKMEQIILVLLELEYTYTWKRTKLLIIIISTRWLRQKFYVCMKISIYLHIKTYNIFENQSKTYSIKKNQIICRIY